MSFAWKFQPMDLDSPADKINVLKVKLFLSKGGKIQQENNDWLQLAY